MPSMGQVLALRCTISGKAPREKVDTQSPPPLILLAPPYLGTRVMSIHSGSSLFTRKGRRSRALSPQSGKRQTSAGRVQGPKAQQQRSGLHQPHGLPSKNTALPVTDACSPALGLGGDSTGPSLDMGHSDKHLHRKLQLKPKHLWRKVMVPVHWGFKK